MYVHRQVTEHLHTAQVQETQRRAQAPQNSGPMPKDLPRLYAAIAVL